MRPSLLVRRATDYLSRAGIDAPEATAELLLESVLGTDRAGLYTRSSELSADEARAFGRALCSRSHGVPVEHITGERTFHGLRLEMRRGVFVPRAETELLVELALGLVDGAARPIIVDVGTGSGAIALAMAGALPGARVLATDVSIDALALAEDNARSHGLAIEALEGDLLGPLPEDVRGQVDLVASNPPYVPRGRTDELPADVRHDPDSALYAVPDLLERLASQARDWLRSEGGLAIEIDDDRGEDAARILAGGFRDVRVERDLAGRERFVLGRRR